MAAEDARQAKLKAAGLREFACRLWTEPLEGDFESWKLAVGGVVFQPDLAAGVRVESSEVDPTTNRVVIRATVEGKTGRHALNRVTEWLRRCGADPRTLTLRRIELYPFEDDDERAQEIHEEEIEAERFNYESNLEPD